MTQATQAGKAAATSPVGAEEKIVLMSVKDLAVDYHWNSRSGEFWLDEITEPEPAEGAKEGEEEKPKKSRKKEVVSEKGSWTAFKASIMETDTNQEAVIARQPTKPGGKPRLTAGFRRYRAILELAEAANFDGPTAAQRGLIRVVVREMTEQQARIANAVENIAREDLSGPDLCWTVGELAVSHKLSDSAIAAKLGKNQSYISKLHRIHGALSAKVLAMWRTSPVHVTIDNIEKEVIMVTKDSDSRPSQEEQEDYFKRVVEGKGGKQASTRGPDAWIDSKRQEAEDLGHLLGLLKASDIIEIKEEDPRLTVFTCVELPKKFKELDPKKKARIEKALLAAFASGVEAGMAAADEDDGDEDGDEDEDEGDDD